MTYYWQNCLQYKRMYLDYWEVHFRGVCPLAVKLFILDQEVRKMQKWSGPPLSPWWVWWARTLHTTGVEERKGWMVFCLSQFLNVKFVNVAVMESGDTCLVSRYDFSCLYLGSVLTFVCLDLAQVSVSLSGITTCLFCVKTGVSCWKVGHQAPLLVVYLLTVKWLFLWLLLFYGYNVSW